MAGNPTNEDKLDIIIEKLDEILSLMDSLYKPQILFPQYLNEEVSHPLCQISACCIYPPGDGSTCAGSECCCTEDYTCDRCGGKNEKV
jgi:hypothetical protein